MSTNTTAQTAAISAASLGLLLAAIFSLTGCGPISHEPKVKNSDYGTVVSVSQCRTSKHSQSCRVATDAEVYPSMQVSSFPDGTMAPGDKIFSQSINNGTSIHTSMCKADRCVLNGVCYWWMPCFP